MLRVVLDTNIFVSGLLSRKGAPAQTLAAWRERRFLLVVSPALIAEILTVLSDSILKRKYSLVHEDVTELGHLLEVDALVVPGQAEVAGSVPTDPDDEIILACALDGEVDFSVSGDHHLLGLGKFRDIPIFTIRQFLERLEGDIEEQTKYDIES